MVRRMIFVEGTVFRISRLVSIPFRRGMAKSRTITSGRSFPASSTASRPSEASPTTSNLSLSRRTFRPWRTMTWSSASRMRRGIAVLQGNADRQQRALPGARGHGEGSPHRGQPLLDADQSDARAGSRGQSFGRVEANSVIAYHASNLAPIPPEADGGGAGPRVP